MTTVSMGEAKQLLPHVFSPQATDLLISADPALLHRK
jgi:hypothetical protein